jgi:hypothetical protein
MRILLWALWKFIKAAAQLFKAFVREKIFRRKPKIRSVIKKEPGGE